jgi:hypothetical protein
MAQFANANVYYCDTKVNADAAVTLLKKLGYLESQITVDEITGVAEYDGKRFGGGGTDDKPPNANFLVVAKA